MKIKKTLRKIFKDFCPPVLYKPLSVAVSRLTKNPDCLFDGDDKLFKHHVSEAGVYAEYGCGSSTIWVSQNTECIILTVDSSKAWLDKVKTSCRDLSLVRLHWADLGETGYWGRPINYDKSDTFDDYTDWIWRQEVSPDVVLLDGRFRVCCFLTSLLHARAGTLIFFDDYVKKKHYHIVERFLAPIGFCGRQAIFCVPEREKRDFQAIQEAINRFRFVFD